jgi:sigma-B regulation protein RsbU (phosphoserine phosphatase)
VSSLAAAVQDHEDLFEAAPCGLIAADRHCRIGRANGTLARLLDAEPEALVGRHFLELLTVGSRLYYETHFAPLLRMSGAVSEVALELLGSKGARIPVLVNATERRDDAGDVISIAIAVFAAKERRQYERSLIAAKSTAEGAVSEVQESAELREQLMAILGHDLRNPLAAISSGLGVLKRERPSERAQKVIGLMEGSVVRASVLIDNVLDFARGRLGGGLSLKLDASRPLAPVIEQVIAEARLIAPGSEIVTRIGDLGGVVVDTGRMGQLVSNLLGNALTHGDKTQPVRLHAAVQEQTFELSVANGGEPIPEETLANLFRPFFRGKVRPNQQGLGLGLYIAAEIAKAHGGMLTVASTAEETRFTLRVPLDRPTGQVAFVGMNGDGGGSGA